MPMPLSDTVMVRAAASKLTRILTSGSSSNKRGVAHRLEPQLVGGVRSVRRELAQEDLLVAVERMDHQVEELLDLRLEPECFACRRRIHTDIVATAAGRLP